MEIRMKYAETFFLLAVGTVSILFLVLSQEYSDIARSVPNICAFFVLLSIVFRLWQIWLKDSLYGNVLKIHKRSVPFILLMTGYTAGVFLIGFVLSSIIFVPLCMFWMGQKRVGRVLIITTIYVALLYLVFVVGFRMPLPESMIGF